MSGLTHKLMAKHGSEELPLFAGLKVRMGVMTGDVPSGSPIKSSSLFQLAKGMCVAAVLISWQWSTFVFVSVLYVYEQADTKAATASICQVIIIVIIILACSDSL
jgi:hypothetical protein